MVRPGYVLTRKEANEIFLILSTARLKLQGKVQTAAYNYWKKFEEALGLNPNEEVKAEIKSEEKEL